MPVEKFAKVPYTIIPHLLVPGSDYGALVEAAQPLNHMSYRTEGG